MRGRLTLIDGMWLVAYENEQGQHLMLLHPDDAKFISEERFIDDVDFKVVIHEKLTGIIKYAKLITQ
jgi:hypothetical protein